MLIFIPVALVAIVVILLSLERTKVVDKLFTVGYEGPRRFIPTITIIEEKGIESEITSPERHQMEAQDVILEHEDEEEEEEAEEKRSVTDEVLDETVVDDIKGDYHYRAYESHAQVPYREDYVILKMVKPDYPLNALDEGLEGYVVVELYVDADGKVAEAWIRSAYGDESFEIASLEAVRQFIFKPIKENNTPIPFWVSFLITFKFRS